MEIWFSKFHTSNVKLSVRIDKQLFFPVKVNTRELTCLNPRNLESLCLWMETLFFFRKR